MIRQWKRDRSITSHMMLFCTGERHIVLSFLEEGLTRRRATRSINAESAHALRTERWSGNGHGPHQAAAARARWGSPRTWPCLAFQSISAPMVPPTPWPRAQAVPFDESTLPKWEACLNIGFREDACPEHAPLACPGAAVPIPLANIGATSRRSAFLPAF